MGEFLDNHPALWNTVRVFLVFAVVFVVCNQFNLFGVGIYSFEIDGDTETVLFYYKSDTYIAIPKGEIQSLELSDDFDKGEPVDVLHEDTYTAGTFKNDSLGEYTLYVKNDCDRVLIIKANDYYYVVNYLNDDSTSELYEALENW